MNTTQRVIKYVAMAFGLGLSVLLILVMVNGLFFGMSLFDNIFSGDEPSEDASYDFSQTFSDVKSLYIEQDLGQLSIQTGDAFRVEAKSENKGISVSLDQGVLSVKNKQSFGLFNWDAGNSYTVITLPKTFIAESVQLNAGAGKVNIRHLAARDLFIDTGTGSVQADSLYGERATINGGVGEISLRNVDLHNLKLDCGVGALSLQGNVTGSSQVNCGVGETRLLLSGNRSDYRLDLSVGLGAIHVNGEKQDEGTYGTASAPHAISLSGGIGAAFLEFRN